MSSEPFPRISFGVVAVGRDAEAQQTGYAVPDGFDLHQQRARTVSRADGMKTKKKKKKEGRGDGVKIR